jgi:hypothetical protein
MKPFLYATLLASVLLTGCVTVNAVANTEEPPYKVVRNDGDFELREYAPMIVAETNVSGSLDDASGRGFRVLADYIFGNNIAKPSGSATGKSQKIAMTAPVVITQSDRPTREKIAMTAPVTIANTSGSNGTRWQMQFVMPLQYTLGTLPTPVNDAVTLRELPARRLAVFRFSGFSGDEKVTQKIAELNAWIERNGMKPVSIAQLARYNAPWTPPPFRRNEVMIEIAAN